MNVLAPGVLLADRYALETLLARGGMASVYRAHDQRLNRSVAIKLLDQPADDHAARVWREDQLTAGLAHPHIVQVYDSGVTPGGQPFIVMELLAGQSLSQLAPLPVPEALALAEEVADALAYAHARDVVHCDLTPQNVLRDSFGRAKLTDFGVASSAASPVGEVVYGSAPFLAPERLRGAPATPAVDLYALGAVLYYLLAGRPPYAGTDPETVLAQAEAGPAPALAALPATTPAPVRAILARALAPQPAARFGSATEAHEALSAARQALELPTATPSSLPPLPPPAGDSVSTTTVLPPIDDAPPARLPTVAGHRSRRWLLLPLVALTLALLVAGMGWRIGNARRALAAPTTTATTAIVVPDLANLGFGAAYHQLLASGLTPGRIDIVPVAGQPANIVVAQDPPPGTRVGPGTPVNFVLRTAP